MAAPRTREDLERELKFSEYYVVSTGADWPEHAWRTVEKHYPTDDDWWVSSWDPWTERNPVFEEAAPERTWRLRVSRTLLRLCLESMGHPKGKEFHLGATGPENPVFLSSEHSDDMACLMPVRPHTCPNCGHNLMGKMLWE
jgi:hypothetical protein